ncbi:hypothetical protein [Roseobacter weihaiensis]|uniref:hypothetical protein n=1 Tax=Roseobacter weihaiensis TaxID=2763262 RepID=UPI001D0B5EA1|nr:hypothetical protein [Roseobacter sp. H9]
MKIKLLVPLGLIAVLAGCAAGVNGSGSAPGGNLPEGVIALAGPNQDLSTARLLEKDGCYWYRHTGPVETTDLPLRTAEGRPICTRTQE